MTTPTLPAQRHTDELADAYRPRGEATSAAGLVVVPVLAGTIFTGRWRLCQTRTGAPVCSPTSLAYARELATLLADLGLDWRRPLSVLKAEPAAAAAVERIAEIADAALVAREPLWWGRSSWASHGPLWRVGVGAYVWTATFAEMWTQLDTLPAGDRHVGHDPAPTWTLRCGAPLCTEGNGDVAAVPSPYEWHEGRPLRTADRAALVVEAVAAGWHHRGAHWLCHECALAHLDSPTICW
ncbi:MAG TPA: hypothetical protein VGL02_33015 [Streptomyces sp.]